MSDATRKPIILSGITPTGLPTIGHYAGALATWKKLQETHDCLFMIADMHAFITKQLPADMRKRALNFAAMYIACGLDPEKVTIFIQSHVPAHAELTWVLDCITGMGECSRMIQFKEKSQQNPDSVNVGLFNYPVLMAADILLYQADLVPVGADQKQHLELTRNLAERFNFNYSPTFTVPEPFIPKIGAKIMSLQDPAKKMSKSDPNERATLHLTDSDDIVKSKIKRAVTDSGSDIKYDEQRPGLANLMTLYHLATGAEFSAIEEEFAGKGYAEFKEAAGNKVAEFIAPIRERFETIRRDEDYLREVLTKGAENARRRAMRTLGKVYKKTGFYQL